MNFTTIFICVFLAISGLVLLGIFFPYVLAAVLAVVGIAFVSLIITGQF